MRAWDPGVRAARAEDAAERAMARACGSDAAKLRLRTLQSLSNHLGERVGPRCGADVYPAPASCSLLAVHCGVAMAELLGGRSGCGEMW